MKRFTTCKELKNDSVPEDIFFERVNCEKSAEDRKNMKNYPACKYSKPVLSGHSKEDPKICFQDR